MVRFVTDSINRGMVTHEMGDNLYNWQSYIQESKAKEERKEEENERCARSLIQVDTDQCRPVPVSHCKVQGQSVTVLEGAAMQVYDTAECCLGVLY